MFCDQSLYPCIRSQVDRESHRLHFELIPLPQCCHEWHHLQMSPGQGARLPIQTGILSWTDISPLCCTLIVCQFAHRSRCLLFDVLSARISGVQESRVQINNTPDRCNNLIICTANRPKGLKRVRYATWKSVFGSDLGLPVEPIIYSAIRRSGPQPDYRKPAREQTIPAYRIQGQLRQAV